MVDVNGKLAEEVIAPQATMPDELVVRADVPEQFGTAPTVRLVVEAVTIYPVPDMVRAVVLPKLKAKLRVEVANVSPVDVPTRREPGSVSPCPKSRFPNSSLPQPVPP